MGAGAPIRIMGVLNASPESFFVPSYVPPAQAHKVALSMVDAGADIIDVGARATGPTSQPIGIATEKSRLAAVLQELDGSVTVSVDTMHPEVLEMALHHDIHAVNDISGFSNPSMAKLVADSDLPAILMAARNRPGDMGDVGEVVAVLGEVVRRCERSGIEDYILDPGIGLWTQVRTVQDNWELCRNFEIFKQFNRPILAAVSRKSFIGDLLQRAPQGRLIGSIALTVLLLAKGASIVRTHDVDETADAIRVFERIKGIQ